MTTNQKECCGNCRFSLDDVNPFAAEIHREVICRRFPPKVIEHHSELLVRFPHMMAQAGWCGEWKQP